MMTFQELMEQIGFRTHRVIYTYFACAIDITLEDYEASLHPTSVLYPRVAQRLNTTSIAVTRGVSRAVAECWDHGDRQRLFTILGYDLVQKPAPGEMIQRLVTSLTRAPVDWAGGEDSRPSRSTKKGLPSRG